MNALPVVTLVVARVRHSAGGTMLLKCRTRAIGNIYDAYSVIFGALSDLRSIVPTELLRHFKEDSISHYNILLQSI